MLVDLREALDAATLPIVIGELSVHGTPENRDPAGPSVPFGPRRGRALPVNWTTAACADRSILGCPRHRSLKCHYNGSAESYLRMGRTFALHLLALDALPKGQVMMWQASQERVHANHVASLSTRCWRLGLLGKLKHFPAVGRLFSEYNVTNLAFGGARREALHSPTKRFFPCQPSTILYYCGSNDVNAGEDDCRAFSASSLNSHATDSVRHTESSLGQDQSITRKEGTLGRRG